MYVKTCKLWSTIQIMDCFLKNIRMERDHLCSHLGNVTKANIRIRWLGIEEKVFNSKKSHHNLNPQVFKSISELREKYLLSLMILFLGVLSLTAFCGKITNYANRKKRPIQFLVDM